MFNFTFLGTAFGKVAAFPIDWVTVFDSLRTLPQHLLRD